MRNRFTPQQRLVLILMGAAVLLVFGVLTYSVATTLPRLPTATALGYAPQTLSPLVTPTPGASEAPPTPTLVPLPTATPTATPIPLSQIDSARVVNELSRIVAGVRDLPPVEQIPVSFPTLLEVTIALLQRYQAEQPEQVLPFYADLGLIPALEPLPQPDYVAQAGHISSIYLPSEREILLVTGRGPTSQQDELAIVYALARATQDQQFDLQTLPPCQSTTDAVLALRALVEGDTLLTTALYANAMHGSDLSALALMAADMNEPTYAALVDHPAFQRIRLFPYQAGADLVVTLYEEGGWGAVNRAYIRPPCSTEQVLHTERYLSPDPVQSVAMPDLGPTLGISWTLVRRDTLGELLTGLHLASALDDAAAAWDAADGWEGDTFVQWEDERGQAVWAWRIAWEGRDDALAFERAYTLLVPRFQTPPPITAETPYSLPGQLWSGPAGSAYVARAGRITTVVWGPEAETVIDVVNALP
ncbi:MAG: hypothetical protein JXD18_08860 [Anaerolineae bacterium]|nr:hypothetical protein [Anaerolineae bacterium]